MRVVIGITGASGIIYAIRLLEELESRGIELFIIISDRARYIMDLECKDKKKVISRFAKRIHDNNDFSSPLASGSFRIDSMVIVPCSLKTLSAVANGYTDTLISRCAINCLKEGRKLILVIREMPLDLQTLRNMVKAREAGAVVMPAMPAFYHNPKTLDDIIDFVVGKILDQLGIDHELFRRWGE